MSALPPSGLVVPIHVAALCIGEPDRQSGIEFASMAAHFERLPYLDASWSLPTSAPNLSESVLADPMQPASVPARGIHLHWALPDALTHGATDGSGSIHFPPAPDRWLVVRVAGRGAGAAVAGWVVESDHLWDPGSRTPDRVANDPLRHNTLSRAVPLAPAAEQMRGGKPYCSIGRVFTCEDWNGDRGPRSTLTAEAPAGSRALAVSNAQGWGQRGNTIIVIHDGEDTETVIIDKMRQTAGAMVLTLRAPTTRTHRTDVMIDVYTGDRHTALGYGIPSFAAAYPHCPNVFGFWDPDPPAVSAPGLLSYHVAGWYSNEARDPLKAVSFAEPVENRVTIGELEWSFASTASVSPRHTICSGGVCAIPWNENEEYLEERDAERVDIAIGNTTTEAVSALLAHDSRDTLPPGTSRHLEALLDAFQLGLLKQLGEPGGAAEADEARHQMRFGSQPGGTVWVIKQGRNPVPAVAADPLRRMNAQQWICDALSVEIRSRRAQIFADWYKYMCLAHPPAGPMRILPDGLEDLTLDVAYAFIDSGTVSALNDANRRLRTAQAAFDIEKGRVDGALKKTDATLIPTGAPRYWQGSEPVVLLRGEEVRPAARYEDYAVDKNDGTVHCRLSSELPSVEVILPAWLTAMPAEVRALVAETLARDGDAPPPSGVERWSQPWIPLMLEWEARLIPQQRVGAAHGDYSEHLIEEHYHLDPDEIDLTLDADPTPDIPEDEPAAYAGSTVLSPRAEIHLEAQIRKYLADNPKDENAKALASVADSLNLVAMSQTLTGLNEALLMRRQTLQLPVSDPVAPSVDHWIFSEQTVRRAVDDANNLAPLANYAFNPIRAGRLKLVKLRVVDAFGQVLNLIDAGREASLEPNLVVAHSLAVQASNDLALPPRLAQPARLLFTWLPAKSRPSPICGWVLFNHVDDSLVVYDSDGNALGSLNVQGPLWQGAPGNAKTFAKPPAKGLEDANADPQLTRFVLGVRDSASLATLLETIDKTMTSISPPGYKQDQGLGLLIGQPLALVRASLRLELQGLPALDESWESFHAVAAAESAPPYETEHRANAGFTKVRFPVRLGDLGSHDDGLIGYFLDDGSQDPFDTLYAAVATEQAGGVAPPGRTTLTVKPVASTDTSAPTTVAMLLDPRGRVHATTGILPVTDISIPAEMYSAALKQMAVTFLATPVLRGATLSLPVPDEAGYAWRWVTHAGRDSWPPPEPIAAINPAAAFEPIQTIQEGWLKLTRGTDGS